MTRNTSAAVSSRCWQRGGRLAWLQGGHDPEVPARMHCTADR